MNGVTVNFHGVTHDVPTVRYIVDQLLAVWIEMDSYFLNAIMIVIDGCTMPCRSPCN